METRNERLKELFNDAYLLSEYIDIDSVLNTEYYDEINDVEELEERIQERIQEVEIIYYSTAIKLLMEHDQSLCDSLEIANEYGYTTDKLNSELLATLLIQSMLTSQLGDFINEVENEEIFND
jgi:hypothetical protein